MGLDLVAVPPAVFRLDEVARFGEVGHDPVGSALGDAEARRNVANAHIGVVGNAQQGPPVVGQEIPGSHNQRKISMEMDYMYWNSGRLFLILARGRLWVAGEDVGLCTSLVAEVLQRRSAPLFGFEPLILIDRRGHLRMVPLPGGEAPGAGRRHS